MSPHEDDDQEAGGGQEGVQGGYSHQLSPESRVGNGNFRKNLMLNKDGY